jgi:alkylation response protein AidB-like acyl-CoA dehydrogenase
MASACTCRSATHEAMAAYVDSGMLAAAQDYAIGGMQLPCVIEMAANAFFSKASVAMGGYAMLTSGNANLLMAHGSERSERSSPRPNLPAAGSAPCACPSRRPGPV